MDLAELQKKIASGRLFHATIVTGGDSAQRERAGLLIAQAAVCSAAQGAPCGVCRDCQKAQKGIHPDIEIVSREKNAREHTVDAMRAVRARAAVLPNEAARSVTVIRDADAMNPQAQNAMLKVLEEPPSHAVFVLLAENPQRLLPTVLSRCETVHLSPVGLQDSGESAMASKAILASVAEGDDMALIRALRPVEKLGRTDLPTLLDDLRRGALELAAGGRLTSEALERVSGVLDQADRMTSVNVSAGHIAGLMLAGLRREALE